MRKIRVNLVNFGWLTWTQLDMLNSVHSCKLYIRKISPNFTSNFLYIAQVPYWKQTQKKRESLWKLALSLAFILCLWSFSKFNFEHSSLSLCVETNAQLSFQTNSRFCWTLSLVYIFLWRNSILIALTLFPYWREKFYLPSPLLFIFLMQHVCFVVR